MRVLGRGGMGTVYEARDPLSTESVAIKALAPVYSFDAHFRRRFESEIETLTMLNHPNIVRILSYGQEEGNLYFAMEMVQGQSLFAAQKAGRLLQWPEVIDIGLQVAAGLRHAHDRGVIHRDLKPGNLLITADGVVKITDFGIAKSFGGSHITGDGNVVGTMDFMAPEQADGRAVSQRTDIYSFGAVLYALLARRPPFISKSIQESIRNIMMTEPPPIRALVPDVPKPLAEIIHLMLAKDPADRIGTAQAVGHRLSEVRQLLKNTAEAATHVVEGDAEDFRLTDVPIQPVMRTEGARRNVTEARSASAKGAPSPAAGEPPTRQSAASAKVDDLYAPVNPTERGGVKTARKGHTTSTPVDPDSAVRPDYYSVVTEHIRRKRSLGAEHDVSPRRRGAWLLFVILAAAVAAGAYGVWYVLVRPPPAADLLAEIDENIDRPERALDPIDRFLELYPDHERAADVTNLRTIGTSNQYLNRRRAQARLVGLSRLSAFDQQLVQIADRADTDVVGAYEQLMSFVTLQRQGTDDENREGLAAAEGYLLKLQMEANRYVEDARRSIQDALDRAAGLTPEQRGDAQQVYLSLIQLYSSFPWAEDLVEQARQRLREIPAPADHDPRP